MGSGLCAARYNPAVIDIRAFLRRLSSAHGSLVLTAAVPGVRPAASQIRCGQPLRYYQFGQV